MEITNSGQGATQLKRAQDAAMATPESEDVRDKVLSPTEVEPGTLGIVFTHGIGGQPRGETLLDWSAPIVRAVSRWAEATPGAQSDLSDEVIRSEIDFEGDNVPFVTINVPGIPKTDTQPGFDRQTWVMTEAWWSERVTPPPLSAVVDWCGRQGAIARVAQRTINHLAPGGSPVFRALNKLGFGLFLSVLTAIVLLLYAVASALAAILPFKPVQEALARFQLGTFLTTSWGDAFLLLRDPVQAANVRGRFIQSIRALRAYGCDRIAVVAHSGGTIVAYMALSDPAYEERADTLITLGEAISLGRDIAPNAGEDGGVPPSIRLAPGAALRIGSDTHQPRWVDFWGSHDPAPCGALEPEFPMFDEAVVDRPDWPGKASRSIRVLNKRSVLDDHGSYWENDEEFLYPLLAQLEITALPNTESRFQPAPITRRAPAAATGTEPDSWVSLRRQRVHMLTLWGRLMFVVPLFAAVGEFVLPGGSLIDWLRDLALGAVSMVPPLLDLLNVLVTFRLPSPVHDIAAAFGILSIATIIVGALIHAALPVGPADAWPMDSTARNAVGVLDSVVALVARLLLLGSVVSFIPWLMGRGLHIPGPGPVVLLGAFAVLALIIGSIAAPNSPPVVLVRQIAGANQAVFAAVGFGLVAAVVGSIAYVALAVPEMRIWLVGTTVAFLLFRALGAVGRWRWRVWDEREREAFRILRPEPYGRGWPVIQVALLGATAVFAGVVVVAGLESLVPWVIVAITGLIFFSILRDTAINATPVGGSPPAPARVSAAVAAGPQPGDGDAAPESRRAGG
ncbi:MAG TPA: hypothetical protein VGQ58_04885 [Candidatus Limnocylindrales bacterium]|jgi:hypothetical protein|nr:hypothetical protein [Candidatus Limnocylindrales bacterium]